MHARKSKQTFSEVLIILFIQSSKILKSCNKISQ